ncbi:ornithine cyclodeaminase family protein [Acinetobacter guillouiae]|uniref:ornithine cyclodeaminase family protein n=1 Tax=Acinetobacter guillouiae TaxID=106649 RepID=UPI002FD9281A
MSAIYEPDNLSDLLPWNKLIQALDDVFRKDVCCPIRHHHEVKVPNTHTATLLLMPAWIEGEYLGVKQVNVFPGNSKLGKPGLNSHYLLSSATTGDLLARFDGNIITARRTAAASALGTKYLSRKDSKHLLMVGAGRVARNVVPAILSVRNIETVEVWDITPANADSFVDELKAVGVNAIRVELNQLEAAVKRADIVSCATLSTEPLVLGDWVQEGTHVDLIGSFTPTMREADDQLMKKARIFADFKEAALHETGDFITPIEKGTITEDSILGDFISLSRNQKIGRKALNLPENCITVFKAVGSSIEDLAAATLAYNQVKA